MTRQKRNWNAINHYAYQRIKKAQRAKPYMRDCELFWLSMFYHDNQPEIGKKETVE